MWPFEKKSARRQEIRRSKSERQLAWHQRLRSLLGVQAISIAFASAIGAGVILNAGGDSINLHVGQSVTRALTARVEFQIEDQQQTKLMRMQARDGAPNYYRLNASLLKDIHGRLMNVLSVVQAHADNPAKVFEAAAQNKVYLDQSGLNELARILERQEPAEFQNAVEQAVQILGKQPLVETDEQASRRRAALEAALVAPDSSPAREWHVPVTALLFNTKDAAMKVAETAMQAFPEALQPSMQNSIYAMLVDEAAGTVKALYRYDSARSIQASQEAGERVPVQYLTYAEGAVLADAGVITPQEMELLKAEHQAYRRAVTNDAERRAGWWLAALGRGLLAFLIVFGVAVHVAPKRLEDDVRTWKKAITAAVVLLVLGVARAVFLNVPALPAHFAVGAQAFAAALLAVVYPGGAIFSVCGALAILITVATQQGAGFLIILLAVSGAMIFGLREVRNRGKIVAVGALAAAAALLTTAAAGLIEQQTWTFALWRGAWAAGATLAAAFLIEGVLPGLERLFRFSTGMTLLEWCDANKPLLRRMAAEAPGTYNHSLLVGALAEAAAKSVGANGLLARAGAYYHDIGKINKPEYFIENQSPNQSRHERLSPAMSLLIIINHVKDGIEMAREYGLPANLHSFIAEHHGTTLVEYFYHAANRARKPGDPEVSDTEFRYPGPKPQSRETAIVMLCDGIEGAVRALTEPTPGRIESVVQEIAQKRLLDGQFDECDLTFQDLATIQKSLVKSLCGIYHARIVYPAADEPKLVVRRETVGT